MNDFQPRINRFGQYVTREEVERRYHAARRELDARYGPGETFEVAEYDYRWVGKGKSRKLEKYEVRREIVQKCDAAKSHALIDMPSR